MVRQGGLGSPWSSLQLCFEESCSMGLDPESETSLCSQAVWYQPCAGAVGASSVYTDLSSKSPWPPRCPEHGLPLNSLIPL